MDRFVKITGIKGIAVPGGWEDPNNPKTRKRFFGQRWLPRNQWPAHAVGMADKLEPKTEAVVADKIVSDAIAKGELRALSQIFVANDLPEARKKASAMPPAQSKPRKAAGEAS